MANPEHVRLLKQGGAVWNEWRRVHPEIKPDLRAADFNSAHLGSVNFSGADLCEIFLSDAVLYDANFRAADLRDAYLTGADLRNADLRYANLCGATLRGARLDFSKLSGTDLNGARAELANFTNVDLREVKGLSDIRSLGPAEISISTIYRSEGQIPEGFLLDCGVPESFITQIPALVAALQPVQFHSCFISYSSRDEAFARRLHERMRTAGLRVWFAPEDIKGGEKLYEQIDRAIQLHDRLLLVLSEHSMESEWVTTEIRRARRVEVKEHRRKLFPIRLVDYETLKQWECFDADSGKDLAVEVREYFIPNFTDWKSHDDFERAFARLLEDLKASA